MHCAKDQDDREADGSAKMVASRTVASGQEVHISREELESMNFRMLSSSEKPSKKGFIIPREIPVELLRIRVIFTRLREQNPQTCGDGEDKVPIEAFQRAFERLFFLLSDPDGFDAKQYDENGDGFVSWGEFFHVYKKRSITIKPTIFERIFLTFDDPDSSHLAQIVSVLVLMTIILSSCCFILGTLPSCQHQESLLEEPKPAPAFETIETICLVLFILEYVARLFTVWDVRSELFDEEKVLDLVIGFQPIRRHGPARKLLEFLVAPANLIDLAAILPALLSAFMNQDGGGFVVLRLIRLTRIFRAFKNPALAEPVIVISRTIQQSTKALYVLVFNLLLGIVIFGSLMYLAEGQGRWSVELQAYERKVGRSWDSSTRSWVDDWAESPFQSIPHTFWWAIVTATTVGYGDHYPTTNLGKIVAVLTMVFSLVILALPVGVIGGTFSQVWDDYKIERKAAADMRQKEMAFITTAIQRLDPTRMSKLMLIEVWDDQSGDGTEGLLTRPAAAKFMGEVTLQLDLPSDREVSRQQRLRLEQNSDLVKRTVTGSITVRYDWTPDRTPSLATANVKVPAGEKEDSSFELHGALKVKLVKADGLVNLDFTRDKGSSSPYCMVVCYPATPECGELVPCVWRTPTAKKNLNPEWQASRTFDFHWSQDKKDAPPPSPKLPPSCSPAADARRGSCDSPGPGGEGRLDEVLGLLRDLNAEVVQVREEVRGLAGRVERLSLQPAASAGIQGQQGSRPGSAPQTPADGSGQQSLVLLPNCVPPPE